jgi:hypothetical protein
MVKTAVASHSRPSTEGCLMTPKARKIVNQLQHATKHSGETQYAIAQATGVSQSVSGTTAKRGRLRQR